MTLFQDVHQIALAAAAIVAELKALNATAAAIAADVHQIATAVTSDSVTGIVVNPGKPANRP